jgi:PIN domain nuclease of toxin-antitoxin system
MKLLLDTHAFIWLNSAPEKLSPRVRDYSEQGTARFYLSLVSPWEMQIKSQLGKLQHELITNEVVRANLEHNNLNLLPIALTHIEQLGKLPLHHRDPFDRMLIAQAQVEGMALVTADAALAPYDVPFFW